MALPRLLCALATASAALLALTGTASAAPDLSAGDDRAVLVPSENVDAGQKEACEKAGLEGSPILPAQFTATVEGNTYVDITGVPSGVQVTGVIVKGANGYNLYLPNKLGPLPWLDLHPPVNASGKPAGISHWFACGTKGTEETSTVPTKPAKPTKPAESTPTTTTTTTAVAAAPGGGERADELAATGFSSPWLVGIGTALVAAGAGALFLVRRRKA